MDYRNSPILLGQLLRSFNRLRVFIKHNQTTLTAQTGQNQSGVPSPAERPIYINTVFTNRQSINRLI